MEEIFLILYLLGAVCLVWYFVTRKPKKKKPKNTRLEELVLKQAQDLDERIEIDKELYEQLRKKKDWIPAPKNKNSEVVDPTRSESTEGGNKK